MKRNPDLITQTKPDIESRSQWKRVSETLKSLEGSYQILSARHPDGDDMQVVISLEELLNLGSEKAVYRGMVELPSGETVGAAIKYVIVDTPEAAKKIQSEVQEQLFLQKEGLSVVQIYGLSETTIEGMNVIIIMEELFAGGGKASLLDFDVGALLHSDQNSLLAISESIFLQLCAFVDGYWKRNGVHCDLKPGNVVFKVSDEPDGPLEICVTDFGIAHPRVLDHSATMNIVGTGAYMSPDRFFGATPDWQDDAIAAMRIYLGLCLDKVIPEIFTQDRGWINPNDLEATLMKYFCEAYLPQDKRPAPGSNVSIVDAVPKSIYPGFSRAIQDLVLALHKENPKTQYANAAEFGEGIALRVRRITNQLKFTTPPAV